MNFGLRCSAIFHSYDRSFLGLLLFALFFWTGSLAAEGERPKIVCFGDSITNRGYYKTLGGLVEADSLNAGVGGHNSKQGLRRIEKDVLAHQPDLVIVFFGTNDLRVDSERAHVPVAQYRKNLLTIIKKVRGVDADVILCTLPPINEEVYFTRHEKGSYDAAGGLQALIESYRQAAQEVAKEMKVPLVDLNQLLLKSPEWLSRDGVHPSPKGTRIIAEHVAKEVKALWAQTDDKQ